MLKSLSQILGEVATQVRDTDSRVAALEATNRAERAEREAWKVRAECAEGRAGDLERKLDATREELLAMHDKTASKVAKIAAKDSAKSPAGAADSPRVTAMQREVESLDRYARESRAIVERLEAGAESLGREVRRLATGEARTRELAEKMDALTLEKMNALTRKADEHADRRLGDLDARLEALDAAMNAADAKNGAHSTRCVPRWPAPSTPRPTPRWSARYPARSALWSRRPRR